MKRRERLVPKRPAPPTFDVCTAILALAEDSENYFEAAERVGIEFALWKCGGEIKAAAVHLGCVGQAGYVSFLRKVQRRRTGLRLVKEQTV